MKLLSSSSELEKQFIRLLRQYKAFYWASAWAGVDSHVYEELCRNEPKISQMVIGIHFYQTHPDFIERFLKNKKVKFIKQPQGTFHPKLYLFYNTISKWELIIGSANFTKQAFSKNTEASILISSEDTDSISILKQSKELIETCWTNSNYFDEQELKNYRIMWAIQRPKINSLSGSFGKEELKPFHQIPFMVLNWNQFIEKIKREHNNTLKNRLTMISVAKDLFTNKKHFLDFTEEERSFIAGIPFNYKELYFENWGCFGSMKGAGVFKNKIKKNNKYISKALDEIPLYGEVTEEHFKKYKEYFSFVFTGNSIATFSRLLAMKRPDIFYCITEANKRSFCKGFDVTYSHINYDSYWDLVVMKILNSDWWLFPKPATVQESKISESRAAFLDAFCYKE